MAIVNKKKKKKIQFEMEKNGRSIEPNVNIKKKKVTMGQKVTNYHLLDTDRACACEREKEGK